MYEYITFFENVDKVEPFNRTNNIMLNHVCATEGWRVVNSGMMVTLVEGKHQVQWIHLLERERKTKYGEI